MLKQAASETTAGIADDSFDRLMANLLVLTTHHSLTQCENALPSIVDTLVLLCAHSDLEHYPEQLQVLLKMRRLWETKLFDLQIDKVRH